PQQPSGILEDSHVRETPQAVAGRIGEDEIAAEGRDGIEAMEVDEAPQAVPNISAFEPPLDVPESFVLEPLNISDVPVRHRAARRRRRLVVDTEATLSDQLVRDQIMDHGDIIRPALDLAPPTRRLMRLKDTATMDALMTNPASHLLIDSRIRQIYAEQLQPGVRPDDSDESLLSSHLRAEMDMAQVVEAPSRLPTPSFAEPDQNFTSPVGAFDYIEQPETITPELTRRRTPTPGPGPEHLPESATPIPEERVEFGETPICT
uniref:Rad21_Rec8 domain-containing protein n=1 Tax=Steinernema glaseri TaxID=37863 RepID=A0A1I8A9D2_9BILA